MGHKNANDTKKAERSMKAGAWGLRNSTPLAQPTSPAAATACGHRSTPIGWSGLARLGGKGRPLFFQIAPATFRANGLPLAMDEELKSKPVVAALVFVDGHKR